MAIYNVYLEYKNGDIYKFTAKIFKHKKSNLVTLRGYNGIEKRLFYYGATDIALITHMVEYVFREDINDFNRITIELQ